jgi:hypothetical protein
MDQSAFERLSEIGLLPYNPEYPISIPQSTSRASRLSMRHVRNRQNHVIGIGHKHYPLLNRDCEAHERWLVADFDRISRLMLQEPENEAYVLWISGPDTSKFQYHREPMRDLS